MLRTVSIFFAAVLAASSAACGPADVSESEPVVTVVGHGGILEFQASPIGEIQEGPNELELIIREADTKTPAAGASVSVRVHMAAMGHDAPVRPELREVAPGEFHVANVVFTMPGRWTVEVHATLDDKSDQATFAYDVP